MATACLTDAGRAQRRIPIRNLRIAPSQAELVVGERRPFVATALGASGQAVRVALRWSSSNPGVVAVGSDGVATGVNPGLAIITVSVEGALTRAQVPVAVEIGAAAPPGVHAPAPADAGPGASAPDPPPSVAGARAPVDAGPPASAPEAPPAAALGQYDLTTTLRRSRRSAGSARASLRLDGAAPPAPDRSVRAGKQFRALVDIPGYTLAPRGVEGQAAVWWPVSEDSLVVRFHTPRGQGYMDLKGAKQGAALAGEIWFVEKAGGPAFQLGTFTATRRR